MLYKFKTRAAADLILLEPHAHRILHIIGKDPEPQGIITLEQLPAAIEALQAAVSLDEQQCAHARVHHHATGLDEAEAELLERNTVHLHQRATPLLEMLRRSLAEEHEVIWGR
ncbi:MAG: DUF1840 domain-containing protein [Giesbergeria sp.]|uniref:DUF1840 domain-containing protein n=1 Tax=Giesbergeria sp. TaxID=2818473 RepID=UPI00261EA502|nr:DUF1840 domain-containing protein [Giesbergeria sp.]MDD2610836.1 DUF1840 domain-containing protein [Giesbergeria sp.]